MNFIYNTPLTRTNDDTALLVNSDTTVFGMPYKFTELADPNGRIFLNMFSPPPLVSIYPCMMITNTINALDPDVKVLFDNTNNASEESLEATMAKVMEKIESKKKYDGRYLVLDTAYANYMDYLRPMLARSFGRLQNKTKFNLNSFFEVKSTGWGGLTYFMSDSSVSESNSNEFGDSKLAEFSKMASGFVNEIKELGANLGISEKDAQSVTQQVQEAQDKLTNSVVNGEDSMMNRITGLVSSSQVNFAKMWKDSSFTRSYNLTFKFQSAYGDQYSIFRDVLVPTFSLMAMNLPRQTGVNAYSAPFFIKADCPGYFTIDTGVISDMTITKSTDANSWSSNGMLTSIEVSITIIDLYPALSIAPNLTVLNSNMGLATYIDNISGLDFTRAGGEQTTTHKIAAAIGNLMIKPQSYIDSTKAAATQAADQFLGNLFLR